LNRLELLAPPFVSRQKVGKRKKQPLGKDSNKANAGSSAEETRGERNVLHIELLVKTPTTAIAIDSNS
jgi:hypothetical protein